MTIGSFTGFNPDIDEICQIAISTILNAFYVDHFVSSMRRFTVKSFLNDSTCPFHGKWQATQCESVGGEIITK